MAAKWMRFPVGGLAARPIAAISAMLAALAAAAYAAPSPDSLSAALPVLQTNVQGDPTIEWRFANAVLGSEVWMLDVSPEAASGDRFQADSSLLDVELTTGGWPRSLPDGIAVTLSPQYLLKKPTLPGELRSQEYENLTGLFVVTWKGRTLPDSEGRSRFSVLDRINDGDPKRGTLFLEAGDHRIIAIVRHIDRGIAIRYERPDPSDPIRDVKVWTPLYAGAGSGLSLDSYSEARLGIGKLKQYSTEPGPGEPDPIWHPQYLRHLREDPSGAMRFMGFLDINDQEKTATIEWSARKQPSYSLGTLVAVSPANYLRHPATRFHGGSQVPYEWLFDLCGRVGKDPWIQVPHLATASYIADLASLAAKELPRGRRLWFEYSNELWNPYGPYLPQYRAAEAEGRRYGKDQSWGSGHLQALALKRFEDAWKEKGRTDGELINVIAGFALSPDYDRTMLEGAKAVSPDIAEALAITTYFGAGLTAELFALPYGSGNPGPEVYAMAAAKIRKDIYATYEVWRAVGQVARSYGVPMVAYEGTSHIVATGYGDQRNPAHVAFMAFLANLHKHPTMYDIYLEHWALWAAAEGRTASLNTDIGGYGYFGYWGAKEDVTESPDKAPKTRAAIEFAALQAGIRPSADPIGDRPRFAKIPEIQLEAGVRYSLTWPTEGGDGAIKTRVLGGELPSGMAASSLPSGGLALSGAPSSSGQYKFVVQAFDRDGDPDYAVVQVSVDPKGVSKGRLLLFDPKELPLAGLARSENREEFRSRFDMSAARPLQSAAAKEGPRLYVPFDGSAPLFSAHYIDQSLRLKDSSPLALSGGVSLTLRRDDFFKETPALPASVSKREIDIRQTESILWFGFRDRKLTSWMGSSLSAAADSAHPEGTRYGIPTRFDALLLWRRDQLEADPGRIIAFGPGEEQSSLILDTGGTAAYEAEWRFVIRQGSPDKGVRYYISEASWKETAAGRFSLSDFNDNPAAGKRWAQFQPSPDDFAIPEERGLKYGPVDFSRVDAVGIAIRATRSWHYNLDIARFLVVGKK